MFEEANPILERLNHLPRVNIRHLPYILPGCKADDVEWAYAISLVAAEDAASDLSKTISFVWTQATFWLLFFEAENDKLLTGLIRLAVG